jgi:hypothetical protein
MKLVLFIGIFVASSCLLAVSCAGQQNEWPISSDKYIFIEHHINTNRECIEGECPKLCIDFPIYFFNEAENKLSVFADFLDFSINRSLKIIYGDGESLSGDAGMGIAAGLSGVYKLPYEQRGLEIVKVEPDGTSYIKYNEVLIILQSGEKWENITTRIDTKQHEHNLYKVKLTITDTIVNHGILDKSKIEKRR